MKRNISFFLFFLLVNLNFSQAYVCEIGPDVGNLQDLLKVVADEPEYDQLFCKGMDICESGYGYEEPVTTVDSNCGNSRNYTSSAKLRIESRNYGSCGMTIEEMSALEFYTFSGFRCLNSVLRNKTNNKAINKVVSVLNSALSKLPSYKGIVRRGASLPASIRELHKEGKVVTYDAFTSSSTRSGFDGEDIFFIFSKTGKPIMGFSIFDNEYEILFKSGAQFKILKTVTENTRNYYIMKEVDTSLTKAQEEAEDKKTLDLYLQIKNKADFSSVGDVWACPKENPKTFEKSIQQKLLPSI